MTTPAHESPDLAERLERLADRTTVGAAPLAAMHGRVRRSRRRRRAALVVGTASVVAGVAAAGLVAPAPDRPRDAPTNDAWLVAGVAEQYVTDELLDRSSLDETSADGIDPDDADVSGLVPQSGPTAEPDLPDMVALSDLASMVPLSGVVPLSGPVPASGSDTARSSTPRDLPPAELTDTELVVTTPCGVVTAPVDRGPLAWGTPGGVLDAGRFRLGAPEGSADTCVPGLASALAQVRTATQETDPRPALTLRDGAGAPVLVLVRP